MTNSQRIESLEEAQAMLREARELITNAIRGTTNAHQITRTLVANLDMLISNDHEWLGRSTNLDDIIEEFTED